MRYNVLLTDPHQDQRSRNVFFIINSIYFGFLISLFYGFVTSAVAYFLCRNCFYKYLYDFFVGFNSFITGGLLLGLTFQIIKTRSYIPDLLSSVFGKDKLLQNKIYQRHIASYFSRVASVRIVTVHVILSFTLFYFAKFPYTNPFLETSMILFGCALFACGVYVGGKIFYIALILQSIEDIDVTEDLFTNNRLEGISTYVNVVTTFTVLAIWFHVNSYYHGPFLYDSQLGATVRIFMFYPAIIAMPVLIVFNYYPRAFVRKLYTKSIAIKLEALNKELSFKENISELEKLKYLSEIDKISKDELKYQLRLALNDLPLIVSIIIMLIDLIVQKL